MADRLFERVDFEVEFDDVVAHRAFLSFVARKAFFGLMANSGYAQEHRLARLRLYASRSAKERA